MAAAHEHPGDQLVDLRTEPLAYLTVAAVLIAFLAIALRAWAQWGTDRAWSVVLVLAMVFHTSGAGLNLALLRYGFGRTTISFERLIFVCKLCYAIGITYALALNLAKLTVLEMYLKIFQFQTTRIWIMLLAAATIAASLANIFVVVFECQPIRMAWLATTSGTCLNIQNAFIGFAILNIVLDVLIPIVPAFGVAKLQADVGRRTLGIIMLVLGSTTVIASAYRLHLFLQQAVPVPPDRAAVRLTTWSTVEAAAAITSSCLPLLKPLVRQMVSMYKSFWARSDDERSNSSTTAVNSCQGGVELKGSAISNVDSTYSGDTEKQVPK